MERKVWLIPKNKMFIEGMEVIKIQCKPTGQMEFMERERLRKLGESRRRRVKCLTNSKVYPSISKAAEELSLDAGNISKVCNKVRTNTKGYRFEFIKGK